MLNYVSSFSRFSISTITNDVRRLAYRRERLDAYLSGNLLGDFYESFGNSRIRI
jgi:hypothetical protein